MAWTETKENARDLLDALETNDKDFFVQLYADGKIKEVDKETKITVTNELNDGKIIEIKFLQGRYKNKVGYTLLRFIEDIGEKRAQEKKRAEQEQISFDEAQAKEKSRLEKLTLSDSNDVQVVVTLGDGTMAYHKIIGKTNLSDATNLIITLSDVKKGTTVYDGGKISALFERSIIPAGEQNLSITTSDNKQIYSGTIQLQ